MSPQNLSGATRNTSKGATRNTAQGATRNTSKGATRNTAQGATPNTAEGVGRYTIPLSFLLLLVVSFSLRVSLKAGFADAYTSEWATSLQEVVLETVPRQLRDFLADYLWVTADEYMHFGPSRSMGKRFLAGSFAGNTEIMPVLELAVFLEPERIDAYGILSQNLSMYLRRYRDGIRVLQQGIFFNKESSRLHELYASIAFIYAFIQSYNPEIPNDRGCALRYLDGALKAWQRNHGDQAPPHQVFRPDVYNQLAARFFVEQGENEKALRAWKASGRNLYASTDYLAVYLRKFERGEPVPALPEQLGEVREMLGATIKPAFPDPRAESPLGRWESLVQRPPPGGGHDHENEHDGGSGDAGSQHEHGAKPETLAPNAYRGIITKTVIMGFLGGLLLLL